jgi:hypothetical protein
MNLIDSALKTSIQAGFEDLFDTFARDVTFTLYKSPEETIVSLDANFDKSWNHGAATSTYEEVSQTFAARIWYLDYEQQYKEFFFRGENIEGIRASQDLGQIKIMLRADGFEYLKGISRATLFDEFWEVSSSEKRVGMLDFKYYIVILSKRK